jgi:hypothetical protein
VERGRDEGLVSEKAARPKIIIATHTELDSVTMAEARNDTQMILLTAISVFSGSASPLCISKFKNFKKHFLWHRNSLRIMITQFGHEPIFRVH